MKPKELVVGALLAAILYVQQVVLSGLPNLHLCAVLIILYAIHFPRLVFPVVAVFILLEGITFGFGIWWVSYLYIWPLLAGLALLFRRQNSALFWAVIGGIFGLCFGALCAIPYLFAGGWAAAFSYWINGIPFDVTHCVMNVVVMLLLFKPLNLAFDYIKRRIH